MISAVSNESLRLVSTQTMRPAAQSLPEVAHVVDVAAIQTRAGQLRAPASLRAIEKSLTSSLACAVSRLLFTKLRYPGNANINKAANTSKLINNSISVKPRLPCG